MKKSAAIIFSLCTVAFAATADDANLLKNGNFARGKTNWVTVGTVAEEANGGVLTLGGKANRAISRQVIQVEEGATYKVSAKITSNKRVQILLGVIPMGRQNYEMYYRHSSGAKPETLTELAEAYVKGSNTVVLKDNPAWKSGNIVFNAKADMSDLPNYEIINFQKFERKDGKIYLTLAKGYKRNFAAGTKVRLHVDGATYPYLANLRKEFPGAVDAAGTIGKDGKNKFPAGTVGFKTLILIPGKAVADLKVEVRDVKVEKVAPAAK